MLFCKLYSRNGGILPTMTIENRQLVEKVFSSEENLCKFIEILLTNATKERCTEYDVPYSDSLDKIVKLSAEHYAQHYLDSAYKEHSFELILDMCNKTGAWDEVGCIIRCKAGIEELLLKIEPTEEFARLHGSMLKTVDEKYLDKFNLKQYLSNYDPKRHKIPL
jgi:hypothetical protein